MNDAPSNFRRATGIAFAAAVSIALVASVSGCSSPGGQGGTAALRAAKSATLKLETRIASFVPAAMVTRTQQTTASKVIYPCLGHSGKSYWPGSEVVGLKAGVDTGQVMTAIAANWTSMDGWTVFQSTGGDGNKTLNIASDKGQSVKVEFVDGPQLSISSLSACFPNDGLSGRSSY